MQKTIGIYDAYNKAWIGNECCGTLTSNSMTSTTHAGTFELAVKVKEATRKGYAVARGGEMQSTSQCQEAKQEEEESG